MAPAQANESLVAARVELAKAATRFDGLTLPEDVARKLTLLKTAMTLSAPADPREAAELTRIVAGMEGTYGKGKWCRKTGTGSAGAGSPPAGSGATGSSQSAAEGDCLDINAVSKILAESRDPAELLAAWKGWHAISPPMRADYAPYVEPGNQGARDGALRRALLHLAGLRAAAQDLLGALALHQTPRPGRGLPRQRLGRRRRGGPPHQDVHRDQRGGLHHHPPRAGPQLLPARLQQEAVPVPRQRQRRLPRGHRGHHRPVRDAAVPGAGGPARQGAGRLEGHRPPPEEGPGEDRVPALRPAHRPMALEGLLGRDHPGQLQRRVVE